MRLWRDYSFYCSIWGRLGVSLLLSNFRKTRLEEGRKIPTKNHSSILIHFHFSAASSFIGDVFKIYHLTHWRIIRGLFMDFTGWMNLLRNSNPSLEIYPSRIKFFRVDILLCLLAGCSHWNNRWWRWTTYNGILVEARVKNAYRKSHDTAFSHKVCMMAMNIYRPSKAFCLCLWCIFIEYISNHRRQCFL